ncbi:hypothetical protein D3C76_1814660 [compost metagenome]
MIEDVESFVELFYFFVDVAAIDKRYFQTQCWLQGVGNCALEFCCFDFSGLCAFAVFGDDCFQLADQLQ